MAREAPFTVLCVDPVIVPVVVEVFMPIWLLFALSFVISTTRQCWSLHHCAGEVLTFGGGLVNRGDVFLNCDGVPAHSVAVHVV